MLQGMSIWVILQLPFELLDASRIMDMIFVMIEIAGSAPQLSLTDWRKIGKLQYSMNSTLQFELS